MVPVVELFAPPGDFNMCQRGHCTKIGWCTNVRPGRTARLPKIGAIGFELNILRDFMGQVDERFDSQEKKYDHLISTIDGFAGRNL
jgi:hypothetical protein